MALKLPLTLTSKTFHQSSSSKASKCAIFGRYPAFETKMSTMPMQSAKFLNAVWIADLSATSATAYPIFVVLDIDEIFLALDLRWFSRRPMRQIVEALARANDLAMAAPIPTPPPVIIFTLPKAEFYGRVGEIVAYGLLCHVSVKAR